MRPLPAGGASTPRGGFRRGRPGAATFAAGLALVLGLAACTGPDDVPVLSPPPTTPPVAGAPAGDPVTREVSVAGFDLELAVAPVRTDGERAVVQLTVTPVRGAGQVDLGHLFKDPHLYDVAVPGPSGLRLLDVEAGAVALVAHDGTGVPVLGVTGQMFLEPGATEPVVMTVVTGAPTGPTVDVLVPNAGLYADVPVVAASPQEVDAALDAAEVTVPDAVDAPVHPLETFAERLGGVVRTRDAAEAVTVAVDADVLFAPDSDTLSRDADAALRVAGVQVDGWSAGTLEVVGHTDDVDNDVHNRRLSERRARSVADRLATLIDLSGFTVEVEGLGESEPAVAGTSEAARALNRRVELRLTPAPGAVHDDAPVTVAAAQAPGVGVPTAPAPGPVEIVDRRTTDLDETPEPYEVGVERVVRRGDYLVGELTIAYHGPGERAAMLALAASNADARGTFAPRLAAAATKVTLLDGDRRVYPVDYFLGDPERGHDPLADKFLMTFRPGEPRLVTVVWPDVGGDTVVVDSPQLTRGSGSGTTDVGGPPWRITGVPVTDG